MNNKAKLLVLPIIIQIALLAVMIVSASPFVLYQQQSIAQQQQQSQSNQTSSMVKQQQPSLPGTSFEIDNMTFSHHTASVNGIQLHYVMGGEGDPVVLLHGWPETWYGWHKVMPALSKNHTVIVPDLRGLGDSSKPPAGYDGKTLAEDIHQLVTQLGFETVSLVGHDIGTQVAYSYAAAHPTEVKKLAVMELPIPGFTPPRLEGKIWWFVFHQTPDVPEALVQGKEM